MLFVDSYGLGLEFMVDCRWKRSELMVLFGYLAGLIKKNIWMGGIVPSMAKMMVFGWWMLLGQIRNMLLRF